MNQKVLSAEGSPIRELVRALEKGRISKQKQAVPRLAFVVMLSNKLTKAMRSLLQRHQQLVHILQSLLLF